METPEKPKSDAPRFIRRPWWKQYEEESAPLAEEEAREQAKLVENLKAWGRVST
jgi:hypothetical protein